MAEDNSNLEEKGYSQEKEDEKTEDETKGQESEFSQTNNTTTVGGVEGEEEDDDLPFPGFVRTSMFCLSQTNPFRLWCLKVSLFLQEKTWRVFLPRTISNKNTTLPKNNTSNLSIA
ncbi:hypothetical protein CHS0354_041796 [Potamilus streckersoni]|uniref:Uncharacterized protein n=1 Tax=Potamilus streckersoni TaxID=2493646 RepID=A0AAE0T146_9BIVA|nr:hypothetical protein CHS0354_041796 [Potamilus streckersoni]